MSSSAYVKVHEIFGSEHHKLFSKFFDPSFVAKRKLFKWIKTKINKINKSTPDIQPDSERPSYVSMHISTVRVDTLRRSSVSCEDFKSLVDKERPL